MYETLQIIMGYFDIAILLIVLYSSIMWFWFLDDEPQLNNASFRFFLNLEVAVSIIIFMLGAFSILYNISSISKGWIQLKVILTTMSMAMIIFNRMKTKQYLITDMNKKNRREISLFKVIIIGLIMTNYTLTEVNQARENPEIQKEIQEKFKNEI
tara:strand:+ start:766 stop:1230 length:465 start_codon:yes stop_codon:yes gene_type:complete